MDLLNLDLINGLPIHPLVVHAAVVFVPLTSIALLILVFFPKFQAKYLNLVSLSALIALGSSLLAKQSGETFAARVGWPGEHAELGEQLVAVTAVLTGAIIGWNLLIRIGKSGLLVQIAKFGGALVAIAALVVTYQTGHSGAKATWESRLATKSETTPSVTDGLPADGSSIVLSADEVAKHNSGSDCWSIVNGNVYNLTSYVNSHPGGAANIESICGKDGSSAFKGQHGGQGAPNNALSNLLLGPVDSSISNADVQSPTTGTTQGTSEESEEGEEGSE